MAKNLQTLFSSAYSSRLLSQISFRFIPEASIDSKLALDQVIIWCRKDPTTISKQWSSYLTHMCITRSLPQIHDYSCIGLLRDLGTLSWWCHQMETFSVILALCAGNSPVTSEFPAQRPVTRSFNVIFNLRLNTRLSKHSWGWWFETSSRSLWRHHCKDANFFLCICKYYSPRT